MTYSKAVATDLEGSTSVKPEVGFNWHNGNLQSVTVMFPKIYTGQPLDELAGTVREVACQGVQGEARYDRAGIRFGQIGG